MAGVRVFFIGGVAGVRVFYRWGGWCEVCGTNSAGGARLQSVVGRHYKVLTLQICVRPCLFN